jgi:tetratricopeptide (TPR) repeat protein
MIRKGFVCSLVALVCLLAGFRAVSGAASAEELKRKGWILSMKMHKDPSVLKKARGLFIEAQKLNPNDADIDYLVGYTYFKEGEFAFVREHDRDQAVKSYTKAVECAEGGLKKDPNSVTCHFGRAASLARILDASYGGKSILRNVFSVGKILPRLRVIEKDTDFVLTHFNRVKPPPEEGYDYAYLVTVIKASLLWHFPGVLGGDKQKAEELLLEAHRRIPDDPLPYSELARLYYKLEHDNQKAQVYCRKVLGWKNPYYFFDYEAFYKPQCEEILKAVQQATASAKR